jgi:hypothetical protein
MLNPDPDNVVNQSRRGIISTADEIRKTGRTTSPKVREGGRR